MEVIQSLRRTEFPDDTRGALKHLERVCLAQCEPNVSIPGEHLFLGLISSSSPQFP